MRFTCVQRPACNHYPHTEIPAGREEWVRVRLSGSWAMQSRHDDCLAGTVYVARRNGERVSPYCGDEEIAREWLAEYRPNKSDEYEIVVTE